MSIQLSEAWASIAEGNGVTPPARRRDQWLLGCRQALGFVGVVLAGVALGVAFFLASGGGGSSWPATISRTSAGWRVIGPAYSDQSVEDLYGMRML